MRKIISLFKRDYEGTRLVYNEVVSGAHWVIDGEGIATVKFDGTACMVKQGILYRRYDAKKGKTPPTDFIPAQNEPDEQTGHWPGWVPVGDGPEDKWHREAWALLPKAVYFGTYELVGPKVQGNPYKLTKHALWQHGTQLIEPDPPRTFEGLREWFSGHEVEGIVWWHPDGRLVKLKRRDYGLPWPVKGG